MLFGFNATKCKTQCRLGVGRIKLLRNKKQIAMKSLRKEVAELLRQGKQGNARIRIEAVMREHRMLHAYEILELYLELLSVRAELLAKNKEIPPDMVEAICSLIYAGERVATDLAEVAMVAKMLVGKYGSVYKPSGFPEEVVSDLTCRKWQVNDTLVDCLAVTAPLPEMKLQFLDEIACEYGVEFDRDAAAMDMLPAAGKPGAVHSYAVEPLAPGGAGVLQPPPLAQGWQPPPGPAPALPPSAQQPAGWQPPCAASVAAAGHVSRMLSGGSVVVRSIGADALPSSSCSTADGPGWSPPQPEDVDKHGRAFLSHVGATAAWRQTRLHGVSQTSSCNTSQAGGNDYPPPATAAAPMDMPPPAVADVRFGGMPSTAQSSGSSTPPLGDKPVTPGSSYADASAAAEAAKQYSRMAQQAAARAEEFAAGQVAAEAKDGKELGCPDAGNSGDAGSLGSSGAASSATAVPRSVSDIQRAYDAAPGPPSKGEVVSPGPPSAPPSLLPPAPAPGPTSTDDAAPPDLDLPSVPGAGAPPPPAVQDELDELTKRFEMLKRR